MYISRMSDYRWMPNSGEKNTTDITHLKRYHSTHIKLSSHCKRTLNDISFKDCVHPIWNCCFTFCSNPVVIYWLIIFPVSWSSLVSFLFHCNKCRKRQDIVFTHSVVCPANLWLKFFHLLLYISYFRHEIIIRLCSQKHSVFPLTDIPAYYRYVWLLKDVQNSTTGWPKYGLPIFLPTHPNNKHVLLTIPKC